MLNFDVTRTCRHGRTDDPIDAEQRQADGTADDVGNRIDRADLVKMDLADRGAMNLGLRLADACENPPGEFLLWRQKNRAGVDFFDDVVQMPVGVLRLMQHFDLHCPEAAATFVLVWYTLGMVLAMVGGALLAPRLLRW